MRRGYCGRPIALTVSFGDLRNHRGYGGIDECVTTFAVVAGATGAHFDSNIIIVLGLE